jgi:hypothetical protein
MLVATYRSARCCSSEDSHLQNTHCFITSITTQHLMTHYVALVSLPLHVYVMLTPSFIKICRLVRNLLRGQKHGRVRPSARFAVSFLCLFNDDLSVADRQNCVGWQNDFELGRQWPWPSLRSYALIWKKLNRTAKNVSCNRFEPGTSREQTQTVPATVTCSVA